ncbi:MAG: hypothetical protein ABR607_01510 [Pyrinomonadaceae bacterium]
MNKRTLSKVMALCAVLALVLIQNFNVSRATGPTDLKSETRVVVTYLADLGKLGRNLQDLKNKATLSRDEFNKTEGDADGLRRRLSDVQQAVAHMIEKLKKDNNWDNFDTQVSQTLTDPKGQEVLRQCGGAKKCLEEATNLASHANEINALLDHLRSKIQARAGDYPFEDRLSFDARMVRTSYSPSVSPMRTYSLGCAAATAIMTVEGTSKSVQRAYCFCVELPVLGPYGETAAQCMQT